MTEPKINTGTLIQTISSTGHENQALLKTTFDEAFSNPTSIDFSICDPLGKNFITLAIEKGRGSDLLSMLQNANFAQTLSSPEFKKALFQLDADQLSCLHYALLKGHKELALTLLDLCPELANYGTRDFTPLNLAESRNFSEVIDKIQHIASSASHDLLSLMQEVSETRKDSLLQIKTECLRSEEKAIKVTRYNSDKEEYLEPSTFAQIIQYANLNSPCDLKAIKHHGDDCLRYMIASAGLASGKEREKEETAIVHLVASLTMAQIDFNHTELSALAKKAGLSNNVINLLSSQNIESKITIQEDGRLVFKSSPSQSLPSLDSITDLETIDREEKVKSLIFRGASLQEKDEAGRNALSYALEEKLNDIGALLMKSDPSALTSKERSGKCALDYATPDFISIVTKEFPNLAQAYETKRPVVEKNTGEISPTP